MECSALDIRALSLSSIQRGTIRNVLGCRPVSRCRLKFLVMHSSCLAAPMEFVWDPIYCTFRYMAIVLCVLKTITGISCNLLLLPPRRVLCTQISHCIFDFFLETHITLPNLWAPQMKVRSNGASAEQTSVLDSFATVGSMYLADICSHARLMSPGNENKLIIFSR